MFSDSGVATTRGPVADCFLPAAALAPVSNERVISVTAEEPNWTSFKYPEGVEALFFAQQPKRNEQIGGKHSRMGRERRR